MIPMTAQAQLARAAELGHVMAVTRRGPWPELGDPHQKIYVTCSCGYEARVRRSESAAKNVVAWHIGKAIGQADAPTNGTAPPPSSRAKAAGPAHGAGTATDAGRAAV